MSRRTPSYVCLLRSARRRTRWRAGNLGPWCRTRTPRAVAPRGGSPRSVDTSRWRGCAGSRATACRRGPAPRTTLATDRRPQNPGCRKESGCRDRARGTTPKGDRRQVRLQVARRPVDHPPDAAFAHRRQFCFSHRTVGALARRRRFLSRCPSAKITCQLGRGGLSASPFCLWPAQM